MLSEFINKELKQASYKLLADNTYFGEISDLKGVWANAKTLEDCRTQLQEVLEDWIFLKIQDREKIPGFEIKVDHRELVPNA